VALFLLFLVLSSAFRLRAIWQELKGLLVALDSYPLRNRFKFVRGFSWSPLWNFGSGSIADFQRLLSREYEAMRSAVLHCGPMLKINAELEFADVLDQYTKALAARGAKWQWRYPVENWVSRTRADVRMMRAFGRLQLKVGNVASEVLLILGRYWATRRDTGLSEIASAHRKSAFAAAATAASSAPVGGRQQFVSMVQNTDQDAVAHACEEFLAYLYLNFILIAIVRCRTLIFAMLGSLVLLMIGLSVYPFEPQIILKSAMVVLFLGVGSIVLTVYAQMHRDAILSYITDTTPGELGIDFWFRMVSFVALPILSLVAWQFPEVANSLFSWIEPVLKQ